MVKAKGVPNRVLTGTVSEIKKILCCEFPHRTFMDFPRRTLGVLKETFLSKSVG